MDKSSNDILWGVNLLLLVGVSFILLTQLFNIFSTYIFSDASIDRQIYKLPKNFFMQDLDASQEALDELLTLKTGPWLPQLPNLTKELLVLSKSQRPDALFSKPKITLQWAKDKQVQSFFLDEPIYLSINHKTSQYQFSKNNEPTDIYLNITVDQSATIANLTMIDAEGNFVFSEEHPSIFPLQEAKSSRPSRSSSWSIDNLNVSPLLLVKQGAIWHGKDMFMIEHGGQEFSSLASDVRIDFDSPSAGSYSLYAGSETTFIYDQGRWIAAEPSSETVAFPMIQLKKSQERFLTFSLWAPYGETSTDLTLTKSPSYWPDSKFLQIEFVASRRDDEAVIKIGTQRLRVRSGDWLTLADDLWIPLETQEEVLEYVALKKRAALIVVSSIADTEEGKRLLLSLFNKERSLQQKIDIGLKETFDPSNLAGGAPSRRPRAINSQREKPIKREAP